MATLQVRGVEIAWSERGAGRPVLLVHETASGSAAWEPLAERLAADARAIAYDRRGWGASTAPEGYRRTTVEEQSEDAAALIEAVAGDDRVTCCGAGAGAVIALDLALRRPELVEALVLIEPPLLQLLPMATEALSEDRRRLEVATAAGEDLIDLYLAGGLPALGPGAARLPEELKGAARGRPRSVVAELGLATGWRVPLPRLSRAAQPSVVVTAPSTPPLLRETASALSQRLARSGERALDSGELPPHLGAPDTLAGLLLELSG